ncbi:MAG: hypothetical protein NTZ64_18845 [Polaromonas sp.]|nr:hypothetical protein [Polaromonas sp.]
MPRYLIQSVVTGLFMCPDLDGGEPVWVKSLRDAGGGVLADMDEAYQILFDNCDLEDHPVVVDLDKLGTSDDYPVGG